MYTFHQLHRLPHGREKNLSLLYTISTIRTFIFAFIGLFIPILLYVTLKQHFDVQSVLLIIGLIYLLLPIIHCTFAFLSTYINKIYSLRGSFIYSQLFLFVFLLLQILNTQYPFINFFFLGLTDGFWWVNYHIYFVQSGNKRDYGNKIGILQVILILTGAIAPILAGTILFYFHSSVLYFVALLITVINIFFTAWIGRNQRINPVHINELKEEIKNNKRDFITFVGAGGQQVVYNMVLPLILLLIFKNYIAIGAFSTFLVLITMIIVYFSGRLSDRYSENRLEGIGALMLSTSWLGRFLIQTPLSFFVLGLLYDFFSNFFYIPIDCNAYKRSLKDNVARFMVMHEIGFGLGHFLGALKVTNDP